MFGYHLRLMFCGSNCVKTIGDGRISIHSGARLKNSRIYVYPGASLTIEDGCMIKNADIYVGKGSMEVAHHAIIDGTNVTIENGMLRLAHHAKLGCRRVWVRFGGEAEVGSYTNVNCGSEIRCDERVSIGSYNQISYNVRIWDTNTHSILSDEERRKVTEEKFPYFGYESSRPLCSPVVIGSDCWIGENAAILKGTEIGDNSIVGYGTLIAGKKIPAGSRVIESRQLSICPIACK